MPFGLMRVSYTWIMIIYMNPPGRPYHLADWESPEAYGKCSEATT